MGFLAGVLVAGADRFSVPSLDGARSEASKIRPLTDHFVCGGRYGAPVTPGYGHRSLRCSGT